MMRRYQVPAGMFQVELCNRNTVRVLPREVRTQHGYGGRKREAVSRYLAP